MDIQSKLFETALGIEEPLYIKDISFEEELGELHIFVDFRRGSKFTCPVCGEEHCCLHDTTEKVWRHLNFFQYKCYIHFRNPKIKCDKCGIHLFMPYWSRPRSGFTSLFEAFVLTLAKEMPVAKISALVDEHDTRIWRILHYHISKAYAAKDLSALSHVGIDETSSRKGHKYISVFIDMIQREIVYDIRVADISFQKWLSWAVRSRLDPIKRFAKMFKSHYNGILEYFNSRLTAGLTEGTNSRIQEIKRRSKGFRNINYFISMIYLDASNLMLPSYC